MCVRVCVLLIMTLHAALSLSLSLVFCASCQRIRLWTAWTVAQTKLIKIWPRRFGLRVRGGVGAEKGRGYVGSAAKKAEKSKVKGHSGGTNELQQRFN